MKSATLLRIISFNFLIISFLCVQAQTVAPGKGTPVFLDAHKTNQLEFVEEQSTYQIKLIASNSNIYSLPLDQAKAKKDVVFSFDYFCASGLNYLGITLFSADGTELKSRSVRKLSSSEGWIPYTIDIEEIIENWGQKGDYLQLKFGSKGNVNIQMRNLQLRAYTIREKEIAAKREEKKEQSARMEKNLSEYLSQNFSSVISEVSVEKNRIIIKGNNASGKKLSLCAIEPYEDLTEIKQFVELESVKQGDFTIEVKRFVLQKDINYDRILSKWVLVDENQLASHAHYADWIEPENAMKEEKPMGRKGIGGFSVSRGHVDDLDELDITSATINIWFTRFMFLKPAHDRIEHVYNGRSYYFQQNAVQNFDQTFQETYKRGIVTAAILLVNKIEQCPDKEIGKLMQHPDMTPEGIYSMPNMTNPESVDCYAAALDFLASRYCRPDNKYGRIHHWIMHNEVDFGWHWTNMGEKPMPVFMDTYLKSMRMCYNIARKYDEHSEVFITLTHCWSKAPLPQFYQSKDMLDLLIDYSNKEGDFEWAVAQHPYPTSLLEPKTWLDKKVSFDYNTELITFKNLEVLNAWIKQDRALYKGKYKRTLWLSENGTNSRTYSEKDLFEQAAGFAYAWKKMKVLDGIDGFQWHNWMDNRNEGGLRIGLRRFPDDEVDPGGIKPVWKVFQAADRNNEDEVFEPYKETIGINDWDEVRYKSKIEQGKVIGKIDAHIHIYDTKRKGSCTFLDPDKHAKIYYPHFPDDFSQVSQSTEISHAIVVEASARSEDNDWIIHTVEDSENILACIVNLDPRSPGFSADIKRYSKNKKFRGIRIRPEKPIDISEPEVVQALGILNRLNLVLELGPNQQKTDDITALAKRYPDMNIIMNHLAGGQMKNGKLVPNSWGKRLKILASQLNIYCKVSALYHLSGENPASVKMKSYKPLIDPVFEAFGPNRILFGSNWTLSEMRGSYGDMVRIMDEYCRGISSLSRKQFYTTNALNAYGINNYNLK